MTPVYEKEGSWYCLTFEVEHGPYKTEEDAWWVYEQIMNSGNCPSCEE